MSKNATIGVAVLVVGVVAVGGYLYWQSQQPGFNAAGAATGTWTTGSSGTLTTTNQTTSVQMS